MSTRAARFYVPCNGHIHSVIKSLLPKLNRRLGFPNVRPDPTIVVRELLLIVFDETTVELDDIGVLKRIRACRYEGR
jgi:hypothetical protein